MKTVWLIEFTIAYEGSDVRYVANDEATAIKYAEKVMEEEKQFVLRGAWCKVPNTMDGPRPYHSWKNSDKRITAYEVPVQVSEPAPVEDYSAIGPFYNGC